ncbi:MAG: hypothetical protein JWR44_701 [Hymenobacter sp.]|nr:hypothetical protein [Hymenobacter sp.]
MQALQAAPRGFFSLRTQLQAVLLAGCLGLLGLSACGTADPEKNVSTNPKYARLLRVLYRNTVPTVSPAALAAELRGPVAPLLLDARTPAEFRVSHLRGARFVNYD